MGRGATRRHTIFELETTAPDAPRVCIEWLDRSHAMARSGPHGHQFLALIYFERGGGRQVIGDRDREVFAGDLYLVAPGELHDVSGIGEAEGWIVEFSADVIEPAGDTTAFLSWHANPLLYPFARPSGGEVIRFEVPAEDRPHWSRRLRAMDSELRGKAPGYREAVLAYLTLVLVGVARLGQDVVGHLRIRRQPVLAEVFQFIEDHYAEPISLKDVAATRTSPPATSPPSSGAGRGAPCLSGSPSAAWPRLAASSWRPTRASRGSGRASATTTPHTSSAASGATTKRRPPPGAAPTGDPNRTHARREWGKDEEAKPTAPESPVEFVGREGESIEGEEVGKVPLATHYSLLPVSITAPRHTGFG